MGQNLTLDADRLDLQRQLQIQTRLKPVGNRYGTGARYAHNGVSGSGYLAETSRFAAIAASIFRH
ncbi:MAG: hypothetical protein K6T90_03305 [Leptolyngbyaceae cyanobacterium HOT.MB2.61]|nr:hypothetical protein [Leptolyngbyaceae cyanobacterium HOT.MB2.61]